jgi:hypothetical protein
MAPHQVVLFLQLVREARSSDRLVYRRTRDKNRETVTTLGCTLTEMFDCVAALRPEQALRVPWPNRHPDHPDELVCEFGTRLCERDVYVKVTAVALEDGPAGCVVSFHFAEEPFSFPFE